MTLYLAGAEPLRKSGQEMRLRNRLRWRAPNGPSCAHRTAPSRDASAPADAVGSQFGSQVADHLSAHIRGLNSAWSVPTRLPIRKRYITCE